MPALDARTGSRAEMPITWTSTPFSVELINSRQEAAMTAIPSSKFLRHRRHGASGCRLLCSRQADIDLLEGLRQGQFCYVLTARQMGKSSLMVRATNVCARRASLRRPRPHRHRAERGCGAMVWRSAQPVGAAGQPRR